ncbi:putative BON1-associated protein 2 [Cocos nucifera]|uniref:Putative BON1-associated protein 2 n=1 Tax=Cocos nucifera TaxID=13894 RepID=A0A8K0II17_COCNU|nr:putative BON1-associated protein 2 [Cocos nucifera]
MSFKNGQDELTLEVTVLSAQSLKNPSSCLFPRRLRPYVTLSAAAHRHREPLYRTRVDETGDRNPTWHDTISVPVDPSFVRVAGGRREDEEEDAAVHVTVLSKCLLGGPTRLGFCQIRPSDVLDGLWPPAMQRRLSYALRSCRHGGRGHGVVHFSVRLLGPVLNHAAPPTPSEAVAPPDQGWGRVAIGIPVAGARRRRSPPRTRAGWEQVAPTYVAGWRIDT